MGEEGRGRGRVGKEQGRWAEEAGKEGRGGKGQGKGDEEGGGKEEGEGRVGVRKGKQGGKGGRAHLTGTYTHSFYKYGLMQRQNTDAAPNS